MPEMFAGYSYLYVEGYLLQNHELIERAMRLAKEAGLQVCLDMASYNIVEAGRDFFDHLITQYVDVVFANESEARAYTGKEPHEALEEIASQCKHCDCENRERGFLDPQGHSMSAGSSGDSDKCGGYGRGQAISMPPVFCMDLPMDIHWKSVPG